MDATAFEARPNDGPTIRDTVVDAVARRIAQREAGNARVLGYDDEQRAAAEEYVDTVLGALIGRVDANRAAARR